jgi:hypothetical protein
MWEGDILCKKEGCFVSAGTSYYYEEEKDLLAAWNRRPLVDAMSVVKAMQLEPPNVHFMDGNSLSGHEAWDVCLRTVLQRLQST